MRRTVIGVTAAALAMACPTAPSWAQKLLPPPTVTASVRAVPIAGFPGTGNFYGGGAQLETTLEVEGSGYGATSSGAGGPPPVSGVNLWLPKGLRLDFKDFDSDCTEAVLKSVGPAGCPPAAFVSSLGHATGEVTIGSTRMPEETTLQALVAPGDGLLFFMRGSTPSNVESVWMGQFTPSSRPYAWELSTLVPAISTVTGGPLASISTIHIKLGAAFRRAGRVHSYMTLPRLGECPRGGFRFAVEVFFGGSYGGEREFGIPANVVAAEFKAPCPKRAAGKAPVQEASPPTPLPGTEGVLTAPANHACVSRRHFVLHVRYHPPFVYRTVTVELNGRQLEVVRGRHLRVDIDLRGLPKGLYAVHLTAVTTTGRTFSGTRSYHTCASRPIRPRGTGVL